MTDDERILRAAQLLCASQAHDDGLWFVAQTASEDYLQCALRALHYAVEGTSITNWREASDD